MSADYRTDIDGLRALAVIPVILFHAHFNLFSGGFIGVDIFFVISGYLITRIILEDLKQSRFTIRRFYERRVRRILPALFTVLCATSCIMYPLMLPSEFKAFGASLLSAVLFVSNFYFHYTSGYFSAAAEEMPLLHTWSLSVEEQFYIFYPIAILLIWRFARRGLLLWIALGIIASFALSLWAEQHHSNANFFLFPTRIWELLLGAFCAAHTFRKDIAPKSNVLSLLGFAAILFSLFAFSEKTPWPSAYTLLPTAGAALLLYAGNGTWTARVLSVAPLRAIGLVSYSAYLWHYPLFVIANLLYISHQPEVMWLLLALTFVLAALTYRFIETPFRKHYRLRTTLLFLLVLALATCLLHMAAYFAHRNDTFYAPFEGAIHDIAATSSLCMSSPKKGLAVQHPIAAPCFKPSDTLTLHIWGDSHASEIGEVVRSQLQLTEYGFYHFSYEGCVPLRGLQRRDENGLRPCDAYAKSALGSLQNLPAQNPVIMLTSRWSFWVHQTSFNNQENGIAPDRNIKMLSASGTILTKQEVLDEIKTQLLALLEHYKVILVYPVPDAGWRVPNYAGRQARLGNFDGNLSTRYDVFLDYNKEILALFDGIDHPNLYRVKPHEILCNSFIKERCVHVYNNQVLYYDDDHLSMKGAALIAPEILKHLDRIAASIPPETP